MITSMKRFFWLQMPQVRKGEKEKRSSELLFFTTYLEVAKAAARRDLFLRDWRARRGMIFTSTRMK